MQPSNFIYGRYDINMSKVVQFATDELILLLGYINVSFSENWEG